MRTVAWGFCYLAVAILLGAFGTHSLRSQLSTELLQTFQTGQQYQVVGAVALILMGICRFLLPNLRLSLQTWSMATGSVVFSGSLYALALTAKLTWGAVTPIGGVLMIGALFGTALVLFKQAENK